MDQLVNEVVPDIDFGSLRWKVEALYLQPLDGVRNQSSRNQHRHQDQDQACSDPLRSDPPLAVAPKASSSVVN